MLALYPNIQPYNKFLLPVTHGHTLYVEEVGNQDGIPVLFIHGGPGSGISENSRRIFDPQAYRIILFDQRGCGQSTPHLSLVHNTTQDLLADIQAIRCHLNIGTWVLYGGSWGSTLAVLYAQQYSQHVKFLILRGVFLARAKDLAWLYGSNGAARLLPEYYAAFIEDLQALNVPQIIEYYRAKFNADNDLERLRFARRWSSWEIKCSTLEHNLEKEKMLSHANECLSFALLEAHYFAQQCFIVENQILDNMHMLENIPAIIVHGRQDMVCPLDNAYELARAWPNGQAELRIIAPAGHSMLEPLVVNAVVSATNFVKSQLAKR